MMLPKTKRYIVSALRRVWRWSKERYEVKSSTKNCPKCGIKLTPKTVKVDHIKPVGKFVPEDNPYIMRMFCPKSNLEGICKECHQKKTNAERARRKAA